MAAHDQIAYLTHDASSLSIDLTALSRACHHQEMRAEIRAIAEELEQLSQTLEELNDAIDTDPNRYTDAFNEDLGETTNELITVFVELQECCTKLRTTAFNASGVAWFFKKGRVARFLRHLEALRSTLLVMRTVLWHGKNYGTHR